jgi:ATP-dependent Clp protease ATP-binding subunit ClpA
VRPFVPLQSSSTAGAALRSCGVGLDDVLASSAALPARYTQGPAHIELAADELMMRVGTAEIVARAEGIALGAGSQAVEPHHVLLALLWERHSVALQLLERHGVTRPQILNELSRRGVQTPRARLPIAPKWGPPRLVSRTAFNGLAAELAELAIPYRFNAAGDQMIISIADRPDTEPPDSDDG